MKAFQSIDYTIDSEPEPKKIAKDSFAGSTIPEISKKPTSLTFE